MFVTLFCFMLRSRVSKTLEARAWWVQWERTWACSFPWVSVLVLDSVSCLEALCDSSASFCTSLQSALCLPPLPLPHSGPGAAHTLGWGVSGGDNLDLATQSLELILGVSLWRSLRLSPQHKYSRLGVLREWRCAVLQPRGSISPSHTKPQHSRSMRHVIHCFEIHLPGDLSRLPSPY